MSEMIGELLTSNPSHMQRSVLSGGLYKAHVEKGDILRMGKVAVLMGRRKFVAFGTRGDVRVMPWISVGSFEKKLGKFL
jgi:hypothetical protein